MLFSAIISILLIYFGLNIIFLKNTVYSILSLILVFFLSSLLLLNFGLDYIPLIFISIYVGALSVLFIFVIMMLNIKIYGDKDKLKFNLIFLSILVFYFIIFFYDLNNFSLISLDFSLDNLYIKVNPIITLGMSLFTIYFIYIILAAIVLFIAMVGSVTLVQEPYKKIKSQRIYQQISRNYSNSYFKLK